MYGKYDIVLFSVLPQKDMFISWLFNLYNSVITNSVNTRRLCMEKKKFRKPLGRSIWFKIFLTILIFLPPITEISYNSANTTAVIASVLQHPLIVSVPILLPIGKLALLISAVITMITDKFSTRVILIYYCIILLIVGIFQNMAVTNDYGFVWLTGNTLVQFSVLLYCLKGEYQQKTSLGYDSNACSISNAIFN